MICGLTAKCRQNTHQPKWHHNYLRICLAFEKNNAISYPLIENYPCVAT